MVKATLRKAEIEAWSERIGQVIEGLMLSQGWSLKEFADVLGRNERQVARWINGKEHPQLDTVFAVEALRQPLVLALATLATGIEIETVIRVKRGATA